MTTPPAADEVATRHFEYAVDAAFCAIRDEGAEPNVDVWGIDEDGGYDYDIDYEPQMVCARRAIEGTGLDVDSEAAAWVAVEQHNDVSSELTSHVFNGEMHKPEARAVHQAYNRPAPEIRQRPPRIIVAPNSVDTSLIWRMRGRAPRLRTNHRAAGSRRSTASRGDPDEGESEPPPRLRLWRHPRYGRVSPNLLRLLIGGRR